MSIRIWARRTAPVALSVALLSVAGAGGAVGAREAAVADAATLATQTVDLGAALDADGRFVGAPRLTGPIDLGRWMLVSDVSRGEAPRFADARRRGVRPAGPAGWSAVGPNAGNSALSQAVLALTAKQSALYLGGDFFSPLGAPDADGLAKWDGAAYAAVGATNNILDNSVFSIAIDGSDLYVGGSFLNADGIGSADRIAKWEGSTSDWESLGGSLNAPVNAIAVSGGNVYVGGEFTDADGIATADYIARYDGSWHNLGSRAGNGALGDHVNAIAVSGANVYVGGLFTNANGEARADYIARWDGSWHRMGANAANTNGALSDQVYALLVSGLDLFVGGNFENVAGIATADFAAKWRNSTWSGLGSNGGNGSLTERVHALAKAGGDIYVGGHFLDADGIATADRVARWDGTDWHALGSDGAGDGAISDTVLALAAFDGRLYVGGVFEDAAGITQADYVASWALPATYRPDGRVRPGTSGGYTGNDIYNGGGKNQKITVREPGGTWITYQVSMQNDSATMDDSFTVEATGTANSDFIFKVLNSGVVVTPAVLAGTYQTAVTSPGNDRTLKIRIKVKASASTGETFTRTIRITSDGDPTKVDVVKVVAKSDN